MTIDAATEQEVFSKLLAQTAMKDRKAFEQLYTKTASRLNSVAMRMLGNKALAEEVLQESFVQIWHNAARYQAHQGAVTTWMRAIVRYRSLDVLNKRAKFAESPLEEEPAATRDDIAQTQDRQALDVCLETLSNDSRQAVLSAYLYGYSREEISARQKTPVNTVKSWLKRGLQRLEQCLRQNAI